MKLFEATNKEGNTIVGSLSQIAEKLNVSKNSTSKAAKNSKTCKGYSFKFLHKKIKLSQREKFRLAIELVRQSKAIIEEHNCLLFKLNEQPNEKILEEINTLLSSLRTTSRNPIGL